MSRFRTGFATPVLHTERMKARWKIIQEVNKYKMRSRVPMFTRIAIPDKEHHIKTGRPTKLVITGSWYEPKLFSIRHIHIAVNIARRHNLVNKETLRKAGYNA